jgi:hypothetical protein
MSIQRYSFTAQRRLEIHKEEEGDYIRFTDHAAELHNLLSTLADIRTALGVGDKPMLSELAGVVGMTVRHREMAIGALQNAIGMLTLYTSSTDELAQSGIQSLKNVLFQINGGNG